MLQSEKQRLRGRMKQSLKLLGAADIKEKSGRLCACLAAADFWPGMPAVAAFLPLPGEPDPRPLLEQALREGKTLLLPALDGESLVFHKVSGLATDLVLHAYGMLQPAPYLPRVECSGFSEIVFLVPGLAFSRDGGRLGRGKGFYDRFFHRLTADRALSIRGTVSHGLAGARLRPAVSVPLILGTAFSCQILDTVPRDENDFPMGGLATEDGVILFR
ncbi:MAG: 5-formyltetrahydrofolate cyclo-ligase [Spirochaetales bacterium]|jgi:5-formyltetrahydrofolate cyclo-ligase|nr:5-formyltetrahydrofolate cyclo-ligase [Spirochaetales bacterium]